MDDASALNRPAPRAIDLLLSRRSGSAKAMTAPGPSPEQLKTILAAGARVPDHGKLAPWRFILFEGDARRRMGELLASVLLANEPDVTPVRVEIERERFLRAPVVVAVVSRVVENHPKAPEWEQVLSAGAACQTMLIAAHSLGYVANWITEWCAYDRKVLDGLGLAKNERIAGFLYIGTSAVPLEERARPDLDSLVTRFGAD